ncbi:MAG TPA: sugar transferase [Solirubrobacteraceae bacterium]
MPDAAQRTVPAEPVRPVLLGAIGHGAGGYRRPDLPAAPGALVACAALTVEHDTSLGADDPARARTVAPAPHPASETAVERALRRAFDVVFSATVLTLSAPILLVAALAIKLDSRGPVLFRQRRLGRGGVPFTMYKLRGMYVDAAERWPDRYAYDRQRSDAHFHGPDDPRVTRVGRILRRLSVDELPNFVNVLRGEMSVVGPRPEIPELAHLYGDDLTLFLSVKPGVTSPAKASGRDTLTFEQTLAAELDYIARRSVWLDLRTIARTAANVVRLRDVH